MCQARKVGGRVCVCVCVCVGYINFVLLYDFSIGIWNLELFQQFFFLFYYCVLTIYK